MIRLCAYTPPEDILTDIVQYLTTAEHIDLPVDRMQFVTNGDTTDRDKDKVLVSLGMDFQQAATPVSVYARIMVRVEEPQSGTLTGLLPDTVYLSFRLAYHIKRYSLKSNTLISCDIDAAPTLMVEGLRQYAYMVLLCTVPMTGMADTPREPFKDEYSGDSAKLILNEDCGPELGGMWYTYYVGNWQRRVCWPASYAGVVSVQGQGSLTFNKCDLKLHRYMVRARLKALAPSRGTQVRFGFLSTPKDATLEELVTLGNSPTGAGVVTVSALKPGGTTDIVVAFEVTWAPPSSYVARPSIYLSSPEPLVLTHFQLTDITEHPELAPANANKLLAESNRFMEELKKMEAALAAPRIEEKELDFGDKT